jgi:NADH:ubiquinone oxidoreductase subunit 2 (subunit N)
MNLHYRIAYYLIAYTFYAAWAFSCFIAEKKDDGSREYKMSLDYYKNRKKKSCDCLFMTLFLFSLAGIPPFAGFWENIICSTLQFSQI